MTPYHVDPLVTVHVGDCLDVLPTLPSESVDSVVTDPPAGIAFMSKSWDRDKGGRTQWVEWMTSVMRECHRVLKPGGYVVVWSLPRTCHWTGWAIEDAGFRIVDQLAHVFASGFPKGKTQLKPAREDWWLARKPGPLQPLQIDACRIGMSDDDPTREWGEKYGGGRLNKQGEEYKTGMFGEGLGQVTGTVHPQGRWPSNVLLSDPELFDQPNPYVVGSGATVDAQRSVRVRAGSVIGNGQTHGEFISAHDSVGGYDDSGGYSRFFRVPGGTNEQPRPASRASSKAPEFALREDAAATAPDDGSLSSERVGADYPSAFIIPKADRAERERGLAGATGNRVCTNCGRGQFDGRRDGPCCESPEYVTGQGKGGDASGRARANVHPT